MSLDQNLNISDFSDNQLPSYMVKKLKLKNFRNYSELSIDINASFIFLLGPNGAGKTNILEALSLLSPGRGIRRARYADITMAGVQSGWAIAAKLKIPNEQEEFSIGTGTISDISNEINSHRTVKINAEKKPIMSLSEITCLSWLTPQMDRIFQGEAIARRRFLDRLVFSLDPNHGKRVSAYEKYIRERSKLLKSFQVSNDWLLAIEKLIAETGVAVSAARKEFVSILNRELNYTEGVFPGARLELNGFIEDLLDINTALDVENIFIEELFESRSLDAERGRTSKGPHRSDIIVYNLETGLPASKCSTGEQKVLLIAIILAEARVTASIRGGSPILLLDEVAAHLDSHHIGALFDELKQLNSQVWVSATHDSILDYVQSDIQKVNVKNGSVEIIN